MLFSDPCGLSDCPPDVLGKQVVGAWEEFVRIAERTDLSGPTRLSGLTARELFVHLGWWDDNRVLDGLLEDAAAGGGAPSSPVDAATTARRHADATDEQVLDALRRSRDTLNAWYAGDGPSELSPSALGKARSGSPLGPLPVMSLTNTATYELAVHALDLAPAGAPAPSQELLLAGLSAVIDTLGGLCVRSDIDATVTAQTPSGGWSFTSTGKGWTTTYVEPGDYSGTGVRGQLHDLLDASAGRSFLPTALLQRKLTVQQLPRFMKLSPLLSEVPGIPGGAALRAGLGGVNAVTGGLGRLLHRR